MIYILINQLLHLAYGIFSAARHMPRNVRYLGPNRHTALIA